MNRHLSESEFADYVLGVATPEACSHLFTCESCRREMEAFGGALAAFNQASLLYSREVAAAHPVDSQVIAAQAGGSMRPAGLHTGFATRWSIGAAVTAVLALAIVLPAALLHHAHTAIARNAPAPAVQAAPAAAPDAASIAEDNQMMAAIETEISQPEVSPLESFTTFRTPVDQGQPHVENQATRKKL